MGGGANEYDSYMSKDLKQDNDIEDEDKD